MAVMLNTSLNQVKELIRVLHESADIYRTVIGAENSELVPFADNLVAQAKMLREALDS